MRPPQPERGRLPLSVFGRSRMLTRSTYHRPLLARQGRRVALAILTAAVLPAVPAGAAGASTLVIEGAGDGHGVGMSQDGAYGFARHGWSYKQILAHYYTATTLGQAPPGAVIRVLVGSRVESVPLERYVRGVVSAEMPSGWPAAALQAQAVASRTYALTAHAGGSRFDVYSDTRSQVYLGSAAETPQTNAAVAATAGQVVLYRGAPVPTYFFADSGGMTEDIDNSFIGSPPERWLVGVVDPYDRGPSSSWRVSLSFASAASRLGDLVKGAFRGIEVLRRGFSPRIVSAEILGSGGNRVVDGPELASVLGLSSTWAYFSVRNGSTVTPEPDRSGYQAGKSSAPAPSAPAPVAVPGPSPRAAPPTGPQGGTESPGGQVVSPTTTGATGGAPAR
ncbi:MAG TPA: SpoIID/LytB domain-containing protein [Solirubrobacteraceae bacterium]|nr:SpoIID/LytB domain-containing protein [Solirubrobacteraceae bacterium]